jgi:hypothetical protein
MILLVLFNQGFYFFFFTVQKRLDNPAKIGYNTSLDMREQVPAKPLRSPAGFCELALRGLKTNSKECYYGKQTKVSEERCN